MRVIRFIYGRFKYFKTEIKFLSLFFVIGISISGCLVGPSYERPEMHVDTLYVNQDTTAKQDSVSLIA